MKPTYPALLGVLLQRYFVERLMQQLNASGRTVAAYRDCFKLLLEFLKREIKKRPTEVTLQDLTAPRILKFLNYLENERHNSIRTRNARFAAVRSFMNYVLPTIRQRSPLSSLFLPSVTSATNASSSDRYLEKRLSK